MCFLIGLIVLSSLGQDDEQFLGLIKDLGTATNLNKLLDYEGAILTVLKKNDGQDNFMVHFLNLVKKDIDILKKISQPEREVSLGMLKRFALDKKYNRKNPIGQLELKEIVSCRSSCVKLFGECSYVDLVATIEILLLKTASFPEQNFASEIASEINRFESSTWKGSPILSSLYLVQCSNSRNTKNYDAMYSSSVKAKEMRDMISGNKLDGMHLGPISYQFQALLGMKRYDSVVRLYKTVPSELLETTDRRYLASVAQIISAIASSYLETGNLDSACIYQELALSKVYQGFLERDHPAVTDQATKLQEFLAKKRDFITMRAIEERFNLAPMPKVAGEK